MSKRIEIPASVTVCDFYKKMGYKYKNGNDRIDEEQLYRLEKFKYKHLSPTFVREIFKKN